MSNIARPTSSVVKVAGMSSVYDSQTLAALAAPSLAMLPATEAVDKETIPDLSLLFDTTSIDSGAAADTQVDVHADEDVQPGASIWIIIDPNNV